ncbi:aldehyde dehydrogenase (NADP(+)) [Microterricola viridarii]|uniref:NADP-dependent aldehyde dehydrogenase n=1 Tax=Microterricola viridarii TaxID=412690 RepID=A0A1H1PP17_9MICO|nr:aldehyde dehydrogenase (NADP(+)) [Microterricola viridarii]SDS12863.1 NADP-dependent aldehyde dehydrogenase [Microterricola viridarii]
MTSTLSEARRAELDSVAARADAAAAPYAATAPGERAAALVAVADTLAAHAAELVALGMAETGLTEARLNGELTRTAVQLRLFADVVRDGGYLDARIDAADGDFVLGARPDVRRVLTALGPVVNFAASNFPFAFSVAGGDTAAALAAGCPVILKGHSGHPRLGARTAELVAAALDGAGMPDGTFQFILGQQEGVAILQDPRVRAGSFTGSIPAGRLLADIAAARPAPIPFFGELGSVNPVFVTPAAIAERGAAIAAGYVASVAGSAGQLCTKPGFVFVPAGHGLAAAISDAAESVAPHRLLNPRIAAGFGARRAEIFQTPGVSVLAEGELNEDQDGQGWATVTIVSVSAETLRAQRERLLEEAFGPLSILVEYPADADLAGLVAELFEGNLTATVHIGAGEDSAELRELVRVLSGHAGRVLFDGWPTGVAVTPAMQHGGPWPATTNDSSTSVGTAAISRFLRGVAYQSTPQALLPAPLQDANPWNVPQSFAPAGQSRSWGSAS